MTGGGGPPAPVVAAYVVDSRPSAGLGHVVRSVALAHALAPHAQGTTIYLHGGSVVPAGVGFRRDWAISPTNAPIEDVAAWSRRSEGSIRIVVVDDPRAGLARHRDPHAAIQVLAGFVDGGDPDGTFDVVINGTAYAEEVALELPTGTVACLGLEYACLRQELRAYAGRVPGIPEVVRRVLVTLGGADPRALTPAVTELVAQVLASRTGVATIDVVLGPGSATADATASVAMQNQRAGVRTVIHHGLGDLTPLMAAADLAISAGGGTLYELSFLGVPTISLPQTPDEELNARAVARARACVAIKPGPGWESALASALSMLMGDQEGRRAMSAAAVRLVDGRGPERLAGRLLSRARLRIG